MFEIYYFLGEEKLTFRINHERIKTIVCLMVFLTWMCHKSIKGCFYFISLFIFLHSNCLLFIYFLYLGIFFLLLLVACMVGMVRSMNHSGTCHFTLLSLFNTCVILFDFYLSCFLCFVWVLFFVFVDDACKYDSKHDQLSLDVKKMESNNSSRKEKHNNISSGNLFVNGSSLILHILPWEIFTL